MPCSPSFALCSPRCLSGHLACSRGGTLRAALLLMLTGCVVLAIAFASGCARTVLVSESSPIRIGPDTSARVYTKTADGWQLSDNRVTVPEGWYCVPPSFVEDHR